ncbi:MAG: NYN domain-containing protein [Crinalium sp.]
MTEINNSAVINIIAQNVYQTLVDIQRINPSLLKEKYRNFPWRDRQDNFINFLTLELNETTDIDTLISKLIKVLNKLVNHRFFLSEEYNELTEKLRKITQLSSDSNSSNFSSNSETKQAISILLLDLENLQLDVSTEKFLTQVCTYPIQVKIAFANWRQMGKLDAELHSRGYDLIHVPAGKDNADGKMIAVGLSIPEHYPKAKEVLVCSSDSVMTNLCNHLLKKGLIVYRVSRKAGNLIISNSQTNKSQIYPLSQSVAIPPLAECINFLRSLITAEQIKTKNQWVKLSKLSALFFQQYKIHLAKVVETYLPGKPLKNIFIDNPSIFVIHQLAPDQEMYITVFEAINQLKSTANTSKPPTTVKVNLQRLYPTIESREQLEKALINLLELLKVKYQNSPISVAHLGTVFRSVYNKSVKEILRKLEINDSLSKFLHSSSKFKITNINKAEYIDLASNYESKINP